MSRKLKSAAVGLLALIVIWVIAVLFWPEPAAMRDEHSSDSAMPTALLTVETPPSPASQQMETAAPRPTFTPTPVITPTPAHTPTPTPRPDLMLYVQHEVQSGETLLSIAKRHNTSAALLAAHLTVDDMALGSLIAIPVPNPDACPSLKVHMVEQGETLFRISQQYGVTVEALKSANGLTEDIIRAGDLVCIP